jgi:hypothetical protein
VDITVHNGILTISGGREEEADKGGRTDVAPSLAPDAKRALLAAYDESRALAVHRPRARPARSRRGRRIGGWGAPQPLRAIAHEAQGGGVSCRNVGPAREQSGKGDGKALHARSLENGALEPSHALQFSASVRSYSVLASIHASRWLSPARATRRNPSASPITSVASPPIPVFSS